ncbi:unnamed protein product [Leptosia nina]|uniref:ATP-dependent RNA helicase n=1 Tax=Leptosia nina TaxID=320188 RepID=A0AAV1J9G8_9NEOP
MDLFIINRYTGESENNSNIQETHRLQKLQQKIEERRKATTNKIRHDKSLKLIASSEENEGKQKGLATVETKTNLVNHNEILQEENDTNITHPIVEKTKDKSDFKVLGNSDFEKKQVVERVLPYWLSHAHSISKNLQKLTCHVVDQPWLHSTLKETLANEGVTHLFPVQEQVIPFILKEQGLPAPLWPHDICVSAPTGSGKTLSFVLPIIQTLMLELGHHIRALAVLPVQELATQVATVFKKYCTNTGLRVALLSGSVPRQKEQQQLLKYTDSLGWVSEADIIVCTAGRLVEHLQNTEGFSLKYLKFLVIDEADRIMDNIQNDWLYHLYKHIQLEGHAGNKISQLNWKFIDKLQCPPQKLLFSATLTPDPELLERWGLFQPKLFSVAPISDNVDKNKVKKFSTPDELKEQFVTCSIEEKPLILFHFLMEQKFDKVLCFTNSGQSAHRLTVLLNNWAQDKIKVAELSASLDRTSRENVLKNFKLSEINVIVSTDALARGIDIPNCKYVISYDPPKNIKTYVHRVGRTGRAGNIGHAITILVQNQVQMFKEILQSGGKEDISQVEFTADTLQPLIDGYQRAMEVTKQSIHTEINNKVKKSIEVKRGVKPSSQKRKHNG